MWRICREITKAFARCLERDLGNGNFAVTLAPKLLPSPFDSCSSQWIPSKTMQRRPNKPRCRLTKYLFVVRHKPPYRHPNRAVKRRTRNSLSRRRVNAPTATKQQKTIKNERVKKKAQLLEETPRDPHPFHAPDVVLPRRETRSSLYTRPSWEQVAPHNFAFLKRTSSFLVIGATAA